MDSIFVTFTCVSIVYSFVSVSLATANKLAITLPRCLSFGKIHRYTEEQWIQRYRNYLLLAVVQRLSGPFLLLQPFSLSSCFLLLNCGFPILSLLFLLAHFLFLG